MGGLENDSAMSGALRRAAVRVPGAALRKQLHPPSGRIPFPRPPGPTGQILRTFTSSPVARNSRADADTKAKQLNQKSVDDYELQVAPRKDAQRKVDDRPWHRENNHSQPKATSPDPSHGDENKGESYRRNAGPC